MTTVAQQMGSGGHSAAWGQPQLFSEDVRATPQYERNSAKYIHAKVTTLAAGHVPMLSMPDRVAAVIIDAANASVK
jgi:hypothetical protein